MISFVISAEKWEKKVTDRLFLSQLCHEKERMPPLLPQRAPHNTRTGPTAPSHLNP